MNIKPTVGRVVWFYPAANQQSADFSPPAAGEPLAAIVAAVLMPNLVNLAVFDAMGFAHARTTVPLVQEGEAAPADGYFATWMPYQVEQAKKAEAKLEAMSAGSASTAGQLVGAAGVSQQHARFDALSMALRTPGVNGHHDVLAAANAYLAHIEGEMAAPAQQPAPGAAYPGYSTLQLHQQRVVDERAELDGRLAKLNTFIGGATCSALDADEQDRLKQQAAAMAIYSDILTERIAAF